MNNYFPGLNDEPEGTANDATHYAASSQRLFGKRYVEAFLIALANTGD